MGIPVDEQETTIQFDRKGEVANIYTSDTRYITKLDHKVEENPEEWRCVGKSTIARDIIGKFYECPIGLISFRNKTVTREMTEEQKEAARKRILDYHKNKHNEE